MYYILGVLAGLFLVLLGYLAGRRHWRLKTVSGELHVFEDECYAVYYVPLSEIRQLEFVSLEIKID